MPSAGLSSSACPGAAAPDLYCQPRAVLPTEEAGNIVDRVQRVTYILEHTKNVQWTPGRRNLEPRPHKTSKRTTDLLLVGMFSLSVDKENSHWFGYKMLISVSLRWRCHPQMSCFSTIQGCSVYSHRWVKETRKYLFMHFVAKTIWASCLIIRLSCHSHTHSKG